MVKSGRKRNEFESLDRIRRIMEHPIPRILSELVECSSQEGEEKASQLVALLIRQSEKYLLEGPVLEAWLWHRILGDVNAFSMNCGEWLAGAAGKQACTRGFFAICTLSEVRLRRSGMLKTYGLAEFAVQYVRCAKKRADTSPAEHRRSAERVL